MANNMLAVMGLGNPGQLFQDTRHNMGFWVVNALAERHSAPLGSNTGLAKIHGQDVLLLKSHPNINESGRTIAEARRKYPELTIENTLVICDDIHLPPGIIRIKRKGSSGGHNGLKSIIDEIGKDFPRIRVGIGKPADLSQIRDHVVGPIPQDEKSILLNVVDCAADAAVSFLLNGIEDTMQKFNGG